ncbi:peptidoglycan DD-metalloendopeptidase family protein [Planococcus halotolerans]|uniref:Peptidase M23 n=1 Tax=Planococcus halotolerans TaxID=2233542 RepID=A0A365KKB4_9BACL|nr:peptidoglycan DD-metalloendopeptidase family protein [Planococcus halotolerans]RAZ73496.1 peptidase M23 [Planococcus halotolerans]
MNPKETVKTIGSILLTKILFSPLGLVAVGIVLLLIVLPVFMSMASKGENFNLEDPDSNLSALSGAAGGAYCAPDGELNEALWDEQLASAGVFSGMGDVFQEVAEERGIDPVLMAAIALHETARGTSSAVVDKNNPGGLMGADGLMVFDSLEAGIASMGLTLHNRIIQDGLVTIADLGSVYAPIGAGNDPTNLNAHWVPNVTKVVSSLGGLTMNCTTSTGEFAQPVPNVTVNSNYGVRIDPFTGAISNHAGVDFACSEPDLIYAAKEGRVVFAEYPTQSGLNTYGNVVVIEHENKLFSLYAHLSQIDVAVGQEVSQLEPVGECGTTGRSTGDHLHFEIHTGSLFGTRVNPMPYLEGEPEE